MAKLPAKIEDWQAPWEKKNEELDAETAKELLFDLYRSVETKTDELKAQKALTTQAETDKADLQTQLDAKVSGETDEAQRLARELATANKKISDRDKADAELATKALHAALDIPGITAAQAKALAPLLKGDDADALGESATAIISSLGVKIGTSVEEEPPAGDSLSIRNGALPVARTKGDPAGGLDDRQLPSKITAEALNALVPL